MCARERAKKRGGRKKLVLAKPYEECCVCVKLGKQMMEKNRNIQEKKKTEPTRKSVAFVAVK
ncbi:Uncharacterized protein APZ42_028309 [Daphnia magna]|uniref:Uncharacterized protein n=1 Tax=Daphnia magna TaxID=35525 RepID=A0A164QNA7_9CRUS|nr:Uncharacterized protein APZ42_028309 [Daphnia magna]